MDYVDSILESLGGGGGGGGGVSDGDESLISGLVEIGYLTEVGADDLRRNLPTRPDLRAKLAKAAATAMRGRTGGGLPSPPFARSGRDTERRAPLGFTEDVSGARFFSLAAAIGASTIMRAKVSRVAHVDRLLIVPSAPGAIIMSLKVGDEEQVLAEGVPVELYGASALTDTVPDNFSPIGPALDFIVTLQNTTAGAITGTIGTKCSVKR
jgi:hypothetical protein